MTVEQLKKICAIFCQYNQLWEMYKGSYDIKESIIAASNFDTMVQNTEAENAEQLISKVESLISARQSSAGILDGEYNGGKANYGSLFNKLEEAYLSDIPFTQQLQTLEHKVIKIEKEYQPKEPNFIVLMWRWLTQ